MSVRDIFPVQVDDVLPLDYNKDHWIMQMHRTRAYISHIRQPCGRIYHMELKDWQDPFSEHFKFCLKEMMVELEFKHVQLWEKVAKRLRREPQRRMNNADTRLVFRLDNMFLVKHGFTFGNWTVDPGHQHVLQTSHAPLLCYELPASPRVSPDIQMRRRLPDNHQMLYNRYVLPPHGTFRIPEGTRYLLMAVQKTIFAVDVLDKHRAVRGAAPFNAVVKYVKTRDDAVPPPTPQVVESSPASPMMDGAGPRPRMEKAGVRRRPLSPEPSSQKRSMPWGEFKIPKKTRAPETPAPRSPATPAPATPAPRTPATPAPPVSDYMPADSDSEPEYMPPDSVPPQPMQWPSEVQPPPTQWPSEVQPPLPPTEPPMQWPSMQWPSEVPPPEAPLEASNPLQDYNAFLDSLPEWMGLPPPDPQPVPQIDFDMLIFEDNPWPLQPTPSQPAPSNPPTCDMLHSFANQGHQLPVMVAPTWMPSDKGVAYMDPPQEEVLNLSMPRIEL